MAGHGGSGLAAVVSMVEVLAVVPRLEGFLALPAGVHEVQIGALLWAQQFEPLEAGRLRDCACPAQEPLLEALAPVLGHGDRIDLDDTHDRHPPACSRVSAALFSIW